MSTEMLSNLFSIFVLYLLIKVSFYMFGMQAVYACLVPSGNTHTLAQHISYTKCSVFWDVTSCSLLDTV
jgi:hypothetical protein